MNENIISIYTENDNENHALLQLLLSLMMKDTHTIKDILLTKDTDKTKSDLRQKHMETVETVVDSAQYAVDLAQRNALAAVTLQKVLPKIIH